MAPRRLTRERVVDVAAGLADRRGLSALTLAAVAAEVGVRTPSLYNHVDGLPGLQRDLALRGISQLGEGLRRATVGRSGEAAVKALAMAYLTFARTSPGLYTATVRAPDPSDDELVAAAGEVVDVVVAALREHDLQGDAPIHATRALRSALHGFVMLEQAGGFGLNVDVDASFDWMVTQFVAGLRAAQADARSR